MTADDGFINSETNRRVYNMLRIGNIHSVHETEATAKVAFDGEEIVSDFIPWITGASGAIRIHRRPTVGEQVMVIAPSGEINAGVILCGIFSDAFPVNSDNPNIHRIDYPDGGYAEYNFSNGNMEVHATGNITIISAGKVAITAPDDVEITGNLKVSGDVTAGSVSLREHIHTGDSGGVTGKAQ